MKHGYAPKKKKTRTYKTWQDMKRRCFCETQKDYPNYGGRGITVCDTWRVSFEEFLADMGDRPEGMTLDRIDSDGPYAPWNCRWATSFEQARNTRQNVWVMYQGQKYCLSDLAKHLNLGRKTLHYRIKQGWPEELWGQQPKCGLPLEARLEASK